MRKSSATLQRLRRNQKGNVMYMTAGLLVPILATMGAGVDLGQAYMAKSRLQQACDAGVLSGRRAMADGTYTTASRDAANRMFNFNYSSDEYSSTGRSFTSSQRGANEVTATATATIPTIVMHAFGTSSIPITVSCTAKLETSNADIMFVLDTTGSMASTNSGDSVNRITALKTEVMAFYDTVMAAQSDTSQIRFGAVPYSVNVHVGEVLRAANPNWISDTAELPSRTANFVPYDPPDLTTYGSVFYTNPVYGTWANTSTYQTGYTQTACNNLGAPAGTTPVATSGVTTVTTGTTTDAQGRTVFTYENRQNFSQTVYRWYRASSNNTSPNNRCYKQSRSYNYRKNTPYSVTQTPSIMQFQNYTYQAMTYDVSNIISGSPMVVQTGTNGTNVTASWNGCIMERDTVDFASGDFPPADAYDLDIDLVPTSNDQTKWKVLLPNIAHPSASNYGSFQTPTPVTTTSNYASYAANGGAVCPTAVRKLAAIPVAQRATFANYINSLQPGGNTYHDVGMVWGARLISPSGIFASENATAPNGNAISRHIVFMTDGELVPAKGIYGFQGQEYEMERVGGANNTEFVARHEARFQAVCNAARARNITVWVVSFGTTLNSSMQACASGDKAFQANNQAQLHAQFQSIASQITRLRLSE
ncbi:MAG: pilus assembly protein [Sphingopyxis sp.]